MSSYKFSNPQQIKVYIINGVGGSGKDTFAKYVKKYLEIEEESFSKNSSVDYTRKLLEPVTNGEKGEKERKLLHDVNVALEEYNNSPLQTVLDDIYDKDNICRFFFVDIREPYRIKKFKDMCEEKGYKVFTVLIHRPDIVVVPDNEGDMAVLEPFEYDYYIENDGYLEDLENTARAFVQRELLC